MMRLQTTLQCASCETHFRKKLLLNGKTCTWDCKVVQFTRTMGVSLMGISMIASKVRHERSLPNSCQTNARAEPFHRTLGHNQHV